MSKYQQANNTRREARTIAGRFRGGKLVPVMLQAFRESESGIINQSVSFELDPIAGRMITPITAEVYSVYVPAQAMDVLKNPDDDYAGVSELVRDKLVSGTPLFGLEEESELSQRMGVVPSSISGVKKVNEVARLGHNCAVNFLRRKKYVNAVQLLAASTAITPALISQTVLERLNGVLDPEDRINGKVNLDLSTIKIPISGLGIKPGGGGFNAETGVRETGADAENDGSYLKVGDTHNTDAVMVKEDPAKTGWPAVFADMEGITTGSVSAQDFYRAERMDALTRQMRQIVDQNPEYGEEIVARWAHGLSIDVGKQPFLLHHSTKVFGMQLRRATDGANLDTSQSDLGAQIRFTVPVPATELGGVVVTFAVLKPDETLASQPHPILAQEWGKVNFVADELALDPVKVTIRELDADCDVGDEGSVALYVGYNGLKRSYTNYGFSRNTDLNTVASKTALWQLEVPMSVTPESVLYPEDLEHYPFADQEAEVCTYIVESFVTVRTPTIFGPTPLEELAAIETEDVFQDA
ncbi:MAG: hypothetical protein JKY31_08345 [Rhodobacteraceae bacterium]|nr:hypothetical protein [Paracoccaceae bacterium]